MRPLKIAYLLTLSAVAFFAALLIFTTFPILGNYKVMVVLSGSMEPQIKLGGLVLVKPLESYQVGDVITYRNPADVKQTTTHRIVEVKEETRGTAFITKGDANDAPDGEPVQPRNIVGKVLFSLPFLGYGVAFVKQPIGFFLLILLPATFIIYDEIRKIKNEVVKIRQKKTLILLIFSTILITSGFTNAYYSDTETGADNTFTVTSWDFWVQTSQADFEAGTPENVDTTTEPDKVLLTGAYSKDGNTLALWHMNEGGGDTVVDATGVNNGTRMNFTDGWVDGKFNKGLEFDGVDDYVMVSDNDSLDLGIGDFTVEAWIKVNGSALSPNTEYGIVNKNTTFQNSNGWGLEIHTYGSETGKFRAEFYITGQSTWGNTNVKSDINQPSGVWHHLAGVRQGSTIKLYWNGIMMAEKIHADAEGNVDNGEPIIIGDHSWGPNFSGTIDEVRISNTPKTSFPVDYFLTGTLESQAFDAGDGVTRDWDRLEWNENLPDGTNITIEIATSDDGSTWSSWFGPYDSSLVDLNGAGVSDSRFIKWKATLITLSSDKTPKLEEVRLRHFSP